MSDIHWIQSSSRYRMSRDFLSSLIDDAHNIEMMKRTMDMMRLNRLNYLLECINRVEQLGRRPGYLNNIRNQSLRLLLHVPRVRAW